ncbi:MAG: response regulator [Gammaproteobacteria bacterium]
MRVLIVDDHPLMLSGVQDVIAEAWSDAACDGVPEADTALRAVSAHAYDLVCVDLSLPDLDGVELIRRLRRLRPSLPIIVLSATDHVTQVAQALEAGAQGYLVKALARPDLVNALRQFRATGHYLPAALRDALAHQRGEGAGAGGVPRLTRRQRDVLRLMAQGLGNQAIAARLALSESTVKGHVSCLLDLLGAGNRTACVNHARALGLLDG